MNFIDYKIFPLNEPKKMLEKAIGDCQKGLFITVSTAEVHAMKPFLEKILAALQFEMKRDTLLLELTEQEPWSFMDICHFSNHHINTAIFFGQMPKEVGLNIQIQKYVPIRLGEKKFLFADDLKKISEDKNLKMQLWKALQAMFGSE